MLTIGLIMAHATNNLMNDYVDHVKGVDKDNYTRAEYGPQTLEHGLLTKREMWKYMIVTGILALVPGIYLTWLHGETALILLGLGAFFVLFYTWPLKYLGLGEISVMIVWGPLMIGGGYFVITGNWSWNVFIASLPYAISVTTVLFGKHIDKIVDDRKKHIFTLPVLLGEKKARFTAISLMLLQYVLIVYLVVIRFLSPILLIVFLALPRFKTVLKTFKSPKPHEPPPEYPGNWPLWFVSFAFWHNRRFGSLFVLGLIVTLIIQKILGML
ncbi:MAG: prenyltransferase [Candidatus Marinimicrobia bacterium]|nr:prenyltransferase [Candidatus Neomarinimicrobiota bacterium]MBL7047579.1 prenyltransferase [Candidatus Neomarinimicrobiota bacterium]